MNQKVVKIKLRALSLKSIGHFKIDMINDQGNNLNKSTSVPRENLLDETFKKGEMWPIKFENPVKWRQLSNAIIKPKSFNGR